MFAKLGAVAHRGRWIIVVAWLAVTVAGAVFGGGLFDRLATTGTNRADVVTVSASNNVFSALLGNDTVQAGDGADLIYGNQGQDIVYGNMGADTLYGGQDGDMLFGGQSSDAIYGNLGADIAYGNLGNDTLFGGQGNDVLYGGQGNDLLFGHLGNDTLVGGLGADRFSFGPGSGADLILGFDQASGDRIDLQGQTYSLGQDAQGNALLILSGGGTIDLVGVTQGQVSASFFA